MERDCPQCGSTRTYVKDVNGQMVNGELTLYMLHHCTSCRYEWQTEKESYANDKGII